MNVLVVDDEVKNAELVAAELRDAGFTVSHVGGGAAALQRLEAGGIDAVITDLRMKPPDGMAVLSEVRRRWPELDAPAARDRLLEELGVAARGDEAFLPHHEPVRYAAAEADYPFVLNSYKTMTHAEGRGANQPHLQELYGVQFDRSWAPWVEIHPADATALDIKDGDWVQLRSPRGTARCQAVLYDGVFRGVVNVPFGFGHTAWGRWAAGRGDNANHLIGDERDGLAGGLARYDARVAVTRA